MISALGRKVLAVGSSLNRLSELINQTTGWLILGPFRKKGLRWGWATKQLVETGLNATPIVSLISLAVGVILALQGAIQLQRVGALSFVATLVSVSVCRELGPLMTAIIVAGRSGAAFAAEIGSMQVSEEVDALVTMGLPPAKFLVVPKVLGLVVAVPCLTIIADVVAIIGGFMVGVGYLGLGFDVYMNNTLLYLTSADILTGLVKAVFFALIISMVGCYQGFSVRGGAEGVGRRTTASVVISIFLVILSDTFFTALTYFVG